VTARAFRVSDPASQTKFPSLSSYLPRHSILHLRPGMQQTTSAKTKRQSKNTELMPVDLTTEEKQAISTPQEDNVDRVPDISGVRATLFLGARTV
jgi:hypothetical protein